MQIFNWNRAQKIEFYREYLDAVFPMLEGERPPEALISACRRFLRRHTGIELMGDAGLRNVGTHFAGDHDRVRLSRFLLDGLREKLDKK
ncbi:MAG TPA: hypothetical protein VGK99_24460 [Acidobacteriota bacterium]|jgi:hypothetical protein